MDAPSRLLGPSWGALGAPEMNVGGYLEASWGLPGEAPWPLVPVLGRSWSLLEHVGIHLEPSSAILSHLGGHLGLSETLLEPSWALQRLATPPAQVQRRG